MAKTEKETKKTTSSKKNPVKKNVIKKEKNKNLKKEVKVKTKEEVIKKEPKKISNDKVKIEKKEDKTKSPIIEVIFLLVVTCLISLGMGWYVCYKMQYRDSIVAKDKYLREFVDEYQNVKEKYYKNEFNKYLFNFLFLFIFMYNIK